jgi:hypothetical protein
MNKAVCTMLKTRVGDVIGASVGALDDRDILYTRNEAAEYLRTSVPTMERWARLGIGPKPLKVGPRDVRYTLRSLRETAGTEAA